jgi:diacylglycerol kinase
MRRDILNTFQINPKDHAYQIGVNRWVSFLFALSGLVYMLRWQKNIRLIGLATGTVCGLALWLEMTRVEWALLLLTMALVWVTEFINASIEASVDLAAQRSFHPMAKVSKDVSAAAVLLASVFAVLIGLVLLLKPLLNKIGL